MAGWKRKVALISVALAPFWLVATAAAALLDGWVLVSALTAVNLGAIGLVLMAMPFARRTSAGDVDSALRVELNRLEERLIRHHDATRARLERRIDQALRPAATPEKLAQDA
jgi:hypothetical protein